MEAFLQQRWLPTPTLLQQWWLPTFDILYECTCLVQYQIVIAHQWQPKFDKIDANKVTAAAEFQKDLSLDSLDRVELVMAFEEEFSFEIPEEKADKLTSCADVAKYIVSGGEQKIVNPD